VKGGILGEHIKARNKQGRQRCNQQNVDQLEIGQACPHPMQFQNPSDFADFGCFQKTPVDFTLNGAFFFSPRGEDLCRVVLYSTV
jgi:hypothetical protein